MSYQTFKDLRVWKDARDLTVELYRISEGKAFSRDFSLKDQMLRAAVSIPSNIAEGCDRATPKEFSRFLDIARGSAAELRTHIDIAHAVGYIEKSTFEIFDDRCRKISAMITNLKKSLKEKMV